VFVVDPQLPSDVSNITLSYTFFDIAGTTKSSAGTLSNGLPLTESGSPDHPAMKPVVPGRRG